jgi:hypothetical protein
VREIVKRETIEISIGCTSSAVRCTVYSGAAELASVWLGR